MVSRPDFPYKRGQLSSFNKNPGKLLPSVQTKDIMLKHHRHSTNTKLGFHQSTSSKVRYSLKIQRPTIHPDNRSWWGTKSEMNELENHRSNAG
jgi:hypothetical protein